MKKAIPTRFLFKSMERVLQKSWGGEKSSRELKQNDLIALPHTRIFENERCNGKDCITAMLNPWLLQANTAANLDGKPVQVEMDARLALVQTGRGVGSWADSFCIPLA